MHASHHHPLTSARFSAWSLMMPACAITGAFLSIKSPAFTTSALLILSVAGILLRQSTNSPLWGWLASGVFMALFGSTYPLVASTDLKQGERFLWLILGAISSLCYLFAFLSSKLYQGETGKTLNTASFLFFLIPVMFTAIFMPLTPELAEVQPSPAHLLCFMLLGYAGAFSLFDTQERQHRGEKTSPMLNHDDIRAFPALMLRVLKSAYINMTTRTPNP